MMHSLLKWLSRPAQAEAEAEETLRANYKARYHHFKLLLNANNKALEAMARLEQARHATEPFGVPFIRANATEVSVSVAQIIRSLDALAPGKYAVLEKRFRDIQRLLSSALEATSLPETTALVLPLTAIHVGLSGQVGGKMANLGEAASRLELRVPSGFVVTAQGYARFMAHNDLQAEINRRLQAGGGGHDYALELSAKIRQCIVEAQVPEDLAEAIRGAYRELETKHGAGVRVSMRSSALGEDAFGVSFAGLYRSVLNVSAEHLLEAFKDVVASKFNLHAMLYRLSHGIRGEEVAMCVGCLVMLQARAGGVAYSQGPAGDDESVIISSVWGLPKAVVDGLAPCDVRRLSREHPPRPLEVRVAHKLEQFACFPDEGVQRLPVPEELSDRPSVSDAQAVEIAELALRLEDHFGHPQDVEWAIDGSGQLQLLQCRPLHRAALAEPRPQVAELPLLSGGVTASPGAGAGPVFVAQRNADLLRFPPGSVLVAAQAAPVWGALVGRAAAVVTEQGSVASHLASVAREFGVPALFGVEKAVASLQPGDLVTVDASDLKVYPGRVEALLGTGRARRALAGTPVHRVLEEVLTHISPLHLLDPGSPEFHPSRCRTLHDITRFAHEKSVNEMFSFARDRKMSEHSSKQLVVDVPMQLWLLNLDDGLRAPAKGRYVHIEDVVSVPMLALWGGMRAVPWEGPPPVDAHGFVSVMFQATANPWLEPATRSAYLNKNYFMISRTFCNLQSRFGFHFSAVEALVDDWPGENYVSFQFKGGAADLNRRLRRVALIADLLRESGFCVDVIEDALRARAEGLPAQGMCEKLRTLGFLIIHTRQIDMVMANEASAAACREKLRAGIRSLGTTMPPGSSAPPGG